jgi:hypothetical protein
MSTRPTDLDMNLRRANGPESTPSRLEDDRDGRVSFLTVHDCIRRVEGRGVGITDRISYVWHGGITEFTLSIRLA